ncbi:autophagy-related protein 27-domain-containing protein [Crucibulum laeve]|uniref:Autophagy-related protein 27-domain-containing protein n=1 Tax=Crucibulum laeve TaxID=68775 RepID=A0A5C3MAW8_9AGAR|nr:autophagy-related protein 27-domain-containing protein [Crucibulum laeve]
MYNLCPLFQGDSPSHPRELQLINEELTPPTKTKYVYDIALNDPGLTHDSTLPDQMQCPVGTWICLTVINTRPDHPSEPPRILQVVPIVSGKNIEPMSKLIEEEKSQRKPRLQIALHGGQYLAQKQKAIFQLECDYESNGAKEPDLLWRWNGTHTFSWKSRHACPTYISEKPLPAPDTKIDPDIPDEPPRDPEDDHGSPIEGDDESRRGSYVFWIASFGLILFLVHFVCHRYWYRGWHKTVMKGSNRILSFLFQGRYAQSPVFNTNSYSANKSENVPLSPVGWPSGAGFVGGFRDDVSMKRYGSVNSEG